MFHHRRRGLSDWWRRRHRSIVLGEHVAPSWHAGPRRRTRRRCAPRRRRSAGRRLPVSRSRAPSSRRRSRMLAPGMRTRLTQDEDRARIRGGPVGQRSDRALLRARICSCVRQEHDVGPRTTSSKRDRYWSVTADQVNFSTDLSPSSARRRASSRSVSTLTIAAASSAAFSGSTRSPSIPLRTNSLGPPREVATSGVPARHASSATMPKASRRLGTTTTVASVMRRATSSGVSRPGKLTRSATPRRCARAISSSLTDPSPPMTSNASPGTSGRANASSRRSKPFIRSTRPTAKTTGGPSRSPRTAP